MLVLFFDQITDGFYLKINRHDYCNNILIDLGHLSYEKRLDTKVT